MFKAHDVQPHINSQEILHISFAAHIFCVYDFQIIMAISSQFSICPTDSQQSHGAFLLASSLIDEST